MPKRSRNSACMILLAFFLAFTISAALQPVTAEPPETKSKSNLDNLIPENVLAYFSIPNVPYFIKEVRETAFMRLMFDSEIQEAFKEGILLLKEKLAEIAPKFDEKVGIRLMNFLDLFSGEFSFAVIDIPEGSDSIPDIAAAVTLGNKAPKVEELLPMWVEILTGTDDNVSLEKENSDGITYYRIKGEGITYVVLTFIDGTLYITSKNSRMQNLLARLKGKSAGRPLSASRRYRTVRRNVSGESETMILYFDLPEIMKAVAEGNPAIETLLRSAKFELYDVAGFGTTSVGGRSVDRFYIRFNPDKMDDPYIKEILSLSRKPVKLGFARMAPKSSFLFVSTNASAKFLFDSVIEGLDPVDEAVQEAIDEAEEMLGVKLREELLPLLDGELSIVSALSTMEMIPDVAVAWQATNSDKLETVILKVLDGLQENGFGKRETNDFRGTEIHSFIPSGPVAIFSPACAIVNESLVAAGSSQTLMRLLSTKKGQSLADHPDFKVAVENSLENSFDFLYMDARPLISYGYNFVQSFVKWFNRNSGMPFRIKGAALPTPEKIISFFDPMSWSGSNDGTAARAEFRSNIGGIPAITTGFAGMVVAIAYIMHRMYEPPLETAIPSLKTIEQAQRLFYLRHRRFAEWQEIIDEGYLSPSLASGVHGKFKYTIVRVDEDGWAVRAIPLQPDRVGKWTYYIDETGIIRRAKLPEMAGKNSEPVAK